MRIYYFGCHGEPGHHLYEPGIRMKIHRSIRDMPWSTKELDGGLCPKITAQPEGRALLHHRDGWTALAFWDRSGDRRLASNSAFVVDQEFGFQAMLELALEHFPEVLKRFHFRIHLDGR